MADQEKSPLAEREEKILRFWKEKKIFEKTLTQPAPRGEFIFYDGPPFATGLPHTGSLLSSIIKDVIPRYKSMRGYRVPRRWGWDCHGLPIEVMIEKKLNLKTKKDIERIGIDVFNEAARASVLEFADEWEQYVDRVGRWVDFKNSYKTMDTSYIESVWWALKRLNEKGYLYEGRKVLLYCPHCETPLAKAEIAMDNTYKDISEEAVTVKFKIKNPRAHDLPENTYLLAWTTTPWTLVGNVALAVGKNIAYGLVAKGDEHFILAQDRLHTYFSDATATMLSAEKLIGISYEPLYVLSAVEAHAGKKHVVLSADFVNTEEGTGIVHTAVMYGEDDFLLGQQEKLPLVQLLNSNGSYNENAPVFLQGRYIKAAEKDIKDDLEKRGLLFERAQHTHSYPHCWRCDTPLIYNAVVSWFINIQKVKQRMLSQNEKITWVPGHLKHGRFKKIVESAPDWTISRNRFWASPLPIWKERGGSKFMVIGSLEELLAKTKKSGNHYFLIRHGEAKSNVEDFLNSDNSIENHLTQKGREAVHESITRLQQKVSIDLVITSPLTRAQETAVIAKEMFGLADSAVITDERLQERVFSIYNGNPRAQWQARDPYTEEGVEDLMQMRRRMGGFLFDIEDQYTNSNILIVTHGDPAWVMNQVAGRTPYSRDSTFERKEGYLDTAQWCVLYFTPYPHTKDFVLDLHRPYVDRVTLVDSAGGEYIRIPEVVDVWVESGAMPFASAQYPRNKSAVNPRRFFGLMPRGYPADFIAEYIAQTRTWFYYMHAMGILLFNHPSFRTVVSTGTVLAADGTKISKSKGNYTDPLRLMEHFGADALRFHLMGSVVMQGEDLQFRDEDVREAHNRVLGILWNSYNFFELYKDKYKGEAQARPSTHILDRWIEARLQQLVGEMTAALDSYDTPRACRLLREYIEDYSTWYLRRSRGRVKSSDAIDVQCALHTQRKVLLIFSKLIAPLMPFMAESIYQEIGGQEESVHLTSWPSVEGVVSDLHLIQEMKEVRRVVSLALQARERAGIKIRQPLATLKVKQLSGDIGLRGLIADELNVKEVIEDPSLKEELALDVVLTPALREEGLLRDCVRQVQDLRKKEGFTIYDRPTLLVTTNEEGKEFFKRIRSTLIAETGVTDLVITTSGELEENLPFPHSFSLMH